MLQNLPPITVPNTEEVLNTHMLNGYIYQLFIKVYLLIYNSEGHHHRGGKLRTWWYKGVQQGQEEALWGCQLFIGGQWQQGQEDTWWEKASAIPRQDKFSSLTFRGRRDNDSCKKAARPMRKQLVEAGMVCRYTPRYEVCREEGRIHSSTTKWRWFNISPFWWLTSVRYFSVTLEVIKNLKKTHR